MSPTYERTDARTHENDTYCAGFFYFIKKVLIEDDTHWAGRQLLGNPNLFYKKKILMC
jgi:hypothetical protein